MSDSGPPKTAKTDVPEGTGDPAASAPKIPMKDKLKGLFGGGKRSGKSAWSERVEFSKFAVKSLASPDRPSRRAAWIFLFSLMGIIGVLALGGIEVKKWRQKMWDQEQAEKAKLKAFFDKQRATEEMRKTLVRLGTFGIAMKDIAGSKKLPGVVGMAEVEVFLQCDTKETCEYFQENVIQAKDVATQALSPMDREDLLSSDGKERLKQSIAEKLNQWLPKGEVRKVFFSRVLID